MDNEKRVLFLAKCHFNNAVYNFYAAKRRQTNGSDKELVQKAYLLAAIGNSVVGYAWSVNNPEAKLNMGGGLSVTPREAIAEAWKYIDRRYELNRAKRA